MSTNKFLLTVDWVMALMPCEAWPRERVAEHLDGAGSRTLSDLVGDPRLAPDDAVWLGIRALQSMGSDMADVTRHFSLIVARWTSMHFARRCDTGDGEATPSTRILARRGRDTAAFAAAREAALEEADSARREAEDGVGFNVWTAVYAVAIDDPMEVAASAAYAARNAVPGRGTQRDVEEALRAFLVRLIRRAERQAVAQ